MFTSREEIQWKVASRAFCDYAKDKGYMVACSVEEAVEQGLGDDLCPLLDKKCPRCSETLGNFIFMWDQEETSFLRIPPKLNITPHKYEEHNQESKKGALCDNDRHGRFEVDVFCKATKEHICDALEAILAFLYPGDFEAEVNFFGMMTINYTISNPDGEDLDENFPVEVSNKLRAIKYEPSTLFDLASYEVEETHGKEVFEHVIDELEGK